MLQADISNSKKILGEFPKIWQFSDIYGWNFTKTNGNFDRTLIEIEIIYNTFRILKLIEIIEFPIIFKNINA